MTVEEVIKKLELYPGDARVAINTTSGDELELDGWSYDGYSNIVDIFVKE